MYYVDASGQSVPRDTDLEARIENLEVELARIVGVVMGLQRGVKAILVAASIAGNVADTPKEVKDDQ
jgi:hypothetical protein